MHGNMLTGTRALESQDPDFSTPINKDHAGQIQFGRSGDVPYKRERKKKKKKREHMNVRKGTYGTVALVTALASKVSQRLLQ